jgi:hypothetical protein
MNDLPEHNYSKGITSASVEGSQSVHLEKQRNIGVKKLAPMNSASDSSQASNRGHGPLLFIVGPMTVLVLSTVIWGQPHHLWSRQMWLGQQPFLPLDFIEAQLVGRIFEMAFWVTWAVQLRWLGKAASADRRNGFSVRGFVLPWIVDSLNTPFVCWILITLLQGISLNLTGGLHFSLADANYGLFIAMAALLGMSVRETRALLTRILHGWFSRMNDSNHPAV